MAEKGCEVGYDDLKGYGKSLLGADVSGVVMHEEQTQTEMKVRKFQEKWQTEFPGVTQAKKNNTCTGISANIQYSKILGSVGRKRILFFKIFLARFYKGHILTLIVHIQKWSKKTLGQAQQIRVGRVCGNTCNIFFGLIANKNAINVISA